MSKGESAINPDTAGNRPPLPEGEGWGEGEAHPTQTAPNIDDTPDCYIEPPSPEVQAAFDHEMRIETGGYPEGEIPGEPPSPPPNAYAAHKAELRRVREAAARDGVPVLPNPLADRFKRPTIRGP